MAAWSMRVTSKQLPVNTANGGLHLHKPEYRGLELGSRQAGRGLAHCTNETIYHSFVCLYAASHEQLMCCRHFSALWFFLYLTLPLTFVPSKPFLLIVTSFLISSLLVEVGIAFPWQPRGLSPGSPFPAASNGFCVLTGIFWYLGVILQSNKHMI